MQDKVVVLLHNPDKFKHIKHAFVIRNHVLRQRTYMYKCLLTYKWLWFYVASFFSY